MHLSVHISISHWSKYTLNHCIPLLLLSWGQVRCQMKRKSTRNSIFLVSAANFQLELNNLQKRPKYVSKCHFWEGFSKFIQLWLKISGSNPKTQVPWSFLLHLTPCLTPGAQKWLRLEILVKLQYWNDLEINFPCVPRIYQWSGYFLTFFTTTAFYILAIWWDCKKDPRQHLGYTCEVGTS
jgi:hypothetical protein